jgi:LmeA-like phospholipid-binding
LAGRLRYRSRMRRPILLLSVVGLLVVLLVGGDFVAARLFEDRARTALQAELDLERPPSVQVRDFPFLYSLARGRLGTVDVAATDLVTGGVTVDDLQLTLRDVRIAQGIALGGSGAIVVEEAAGRARIGEREINRALAERLGDATIRLDSRGVRVEGSQEVLGQRVDTLIRGRLEVRGGRLVFVPETVDAGGAPLPAATLDALRSRGFEAPLPLPGDLTPERVVTEPGALVVFGRLDQLRLEVAGSGA